MAILNIRGTSGSGKSTLARAIMAKYRDKTPHYIEGRKQPFGYWFQTPEGDSHPPLWVVGHYESATGGCDTISAGIQACYDQIYAALSFGADILYEGLIVQSDVKRAIKLHQDFPGQLLIISLTTPYEQCIEGVNSRRAARGVTAEFNHGHLRKKGEEVKRQTAKFKDAGVDIRLLDRDAAVQAALAHMGW